MSAMLQSNNIFPRKHPTLVHAPVTTPHAMAAVSHESPSDLFSSTQPPPSCVPLKN